MGATREPVIFSSVIEGARKAFDKQMTPELLASLRAIGMDFDAPQPAYAMETFLTGLAVIADKVAPGQPSEAQHRQIGRDFMYGYMQTALGFALLSMGRVIGVRRMLLRFGRGLKTTGNYVDTQAEERGPTDVHIVTRILPEFRSFITPRWRAIAHYRVGVLEAALDLLKADGSVALTEVSQDETHFRVTWKPR